ncbi:hypothetical protein ABTL81_19335, partial [Acinetobacter baumannii]
LACWQPSGAFSERQQGIDKSLNRLCNAVRLQRVPNQSTLRGEVGVFGEFDARSEVGGEERRISKVDMQCFSWIKLWDWQRPNEIVEVTRVAL